MNTAVTDARELPLYGLSEAALYLRLPIKTLEYWAFGSSHAKPLIRVAGRHPRVLSFMNLLECHMLAAMRSIYDLRLSKIRNAIANLSHPNWYKHPLIEKPLYTNRIDILLSDIDGKVANISKHKDVVQFVIPEIVKIHMERIEYDQRTLKFYPFVRERKADEPKLIVINPAVGFGKPVIAGTGISTAVVASRFNARESIPDLAKEYGLEEGQIEEAIRWETRAIAA